MSNPYDPNQPPPPYAGWGTPPPAQSQGQLVTPVQPWISPMGITVPLRTPSGGPSKWGIGCLVVLLVIFTCCGGMFAASFFVFKRNAVRVIEQQAAALGEGNATYACSFNTATLNMNTPCPQYVQWLNAYAPWFAGSTIHSDRIDSMPDANYRRRYTVRVRGTGVHGTGRLTFSVVSVDGHMQIDAIVSTQ